MSLHYSSGKLLLQNTSDDEWYYVEVRIDDDDGLPHIYPHQDIAGDYSLSDYDSYAIIRSAEGYLYKLSLRTDVDGNVTYDLSIADLPVTQLPVRIFIKDTTTGLSYQLIVTEGVDGVGYPELVTAGSIVSTGTTLDRPFACHSPVTTTDNICKSAANFLTKATVLIPTQVPLPTGGFLLGAGGEGLQDTDGDRIRESGN